MYVTVVPNRKSPPAILLRESYREEGKVKNRTVANISDWPPEQIEALKAVLKGDLTGVGPMPEVEASLPHGHVAAVLGTARHIGMENLLSNKWTRDRDLVMALVCGRVLAPSSKLALAQALQPGSAHHTLGQELGVEGATEDELYGAMDWLLARQEKIENTLAKKHLSNGCTVLYDLSSSYFEGSTCPLAKFGYSRDHRSDRLPWVTHAFPRILRQVSYGLLCNGEGIPVAIEVVEGNTGDPQTIPAQGGSMSASHGEQEHALRAIHGEKLKERFGLARVVVVGDRGTVTTTQIEGAIEPGGFGWISALKHGAVEKLALEKVIQPSLFDETGIAEISHASFPGERLIACMNPFMKIKREKVRENLLSLTEKELAKVAAACVRERKPLEGRDQVGLAAGRVVNRFGMAKYFRLHVGDHSLRYARHDEVIAREATTDGIYVIRTSEPEEAFPAEKAVSTYKELAKVERAFRCMKGVDLQVRPIHHHLADRVKAHLFLCMLAYYIEWHLRQAWAGLLLFQDEEGGTRTTPVAPVEPSESAKAKKRSPRSNPDLPLQTYRGLIQSLAALSRSIIRLGSGTYTRCAKPTPLQAEAFKRLGLALP